MGKNWESNALCFADHTLVDHFKKMLFICGLIIQYFSRPTFKKLHLGGCRKQKDLSVLRQTIQQQDRKWPKNIQYFPTSTYTWIGLSATFVMTGSMPGSSRKSTKMSFIRVNHNSSCAKRASSLASGEQYAIERTTPSKNWLSNAPCFADCLKKMLFICGIIIQYFSRPTFKKLHLGGCRKQRV